MEGEGSGYRMGLLLVSIIVVVSVSLGGGRGVSAEEATEIHHVVGGDRGWDIATDIAAWSADRVFRVGDKIWFAYSAAGESIVELGSREELEACDVTNPIRMYTDGLDSITLEGVGSRFFASGRPENCRKGLKLNVDVLPQQPTQMEMNPLTITISSHELLDAVAAGPTSAAFPLPAAAPLPLLVLGLLCFLHIF
ncbi:uclacyanin 1-like [Macadamia integrifolia]|uniref:uclacyanin 1-like n=1 Tax=Macadamia integrifolia TaxID=60698 RepID=UPI001C4E3BBB|nr:uclacyanin 1-like [Macadamia integrifolia]